MVQYGVNSTSWGNYGNTKTSASLVTNHSIALSSLSAGTTYYFRVRSSDAAGNAVTSGEFSLTTDETPPPPPPDTTAPVITVPPAAGSVGETSASITWRTDEASDSVVQYGVTSTSWGNYSNTKTSASLVTSHSIALSSLSAGTTYYFRVRSSDAAGNAVTSGEFSFSTDETPPPPPPDTTAPVITSYSVNQYYPKRGRDSVDNE